MSSSNAAIRPNRLPLAAGYAGLALTIAAILVLYADHLTANVLAAHIRAGYPSYTAARIDAATTVYLVYLSVLGVLGIAGWAITIGAVARRKPWARWLATGLFVAGTGIALFNLTVRDTSGDTGLPALLGWAGILPCVAGLVLVITLWRRGTTDRKGIR